VGEGRMIHMSKPEVAQPDKYRPGG